MILLYHTSISVEGRKREGKKENENENETEKWIKEAITKDEYYEYQHFNRFQKIGSGAYGTVYCANWKNSGQHFVLKKMLLLVR